MTTQERISLLVDLLEGGNAKRFADKASINPACLSRVRSGKASPNSYISRILSAYPEVRKDWLVDGKGKPFKHDDEKSRMEKKIDALDKEVRRLAGLVEELSKAYHPG